jgi:hypothetical protein
MSLKSTVRSNGYYWYRMFVKHFEINTSKNMKLTKPDTVKVRLSGNSSISKVALAAYFHRAHYNLPMALAAYSHRAHYNSPMALAAYFCRYPASRGIS